MVFHHCVCHSSTLLLHEKVDPPTSQPPFLPFLSSCSVSCFLNMSVKGHLCNFGGMNFHLPVSEEHTFWEPDHRCLVDCVQRMLEKMWLLALTLG